MNADWSAWSQATRLPGSGALQLMGAGAHVARVLVERLVDDADGDTETLEFSYRGVDYEVDLSARDAAALDKLLEPYLRASRRRDSRLADPRPAVEVPSAVPLAADIRAWARSQGIPVSDRGRVSADVVQRYLDARGR